MNILNRKNKVSMKDVLSRFNFVMIGAIIVMIIFFALINMKTLSTMSDITMRNQEMLEVYNTIDEAHLTMRLYIQDRDENKLSSFKNNIHKSKYNVMKFRDRGYTSWRYELLKNMIDTYEEVAMKMVDASPSEFQNDYDLYSRSYDTLKNTSIEYFSILVKDMEYESIAAQTSLQVSIAIGIISITLLVVWIFVMSNSLTKWFLYPIKNIMSNIQKVKENTFEVDALDLKSIELQELSDSVIDMAGQIETNIAMAKEITELEQRMLEEKNIYLQSQEMITKASLKAIQNQVNPHFLFNTLNVIYKLTLNDDAKSARMLLERLSQLLRYSLDYAEGESTLSHEINAMYNYIYIQEQRFQDRIRFEVDIAEDYTNLEIPGYIIMPILENSIEYGFKEMAKGCVINVEISQNKNILTLSISDNGEGMDEAKVDSIYMNDYEAFGRDLDLTLYTMMQRLKVHFGDKVSTTINTCRDCGFELVIEIEVI